MNAATAQNLNNNFSETIQGCRVAVQELLESVKFMNNQAVPTVSKEDVEEKLKARKIAASTLVGLTQKKDQMSEVEQSLLEDALQELTDAQSHKTRVDRLVRAHWTESNKDQPLNERQQKIFDLLEDNICNYMPRNYKLQQKLYKKVQNAWTRKVYNKATARQESIQDVDYFHPARTALFDLFFQHQNRVTKSEQAELEAKENPVETEVKRLEILNSIINTQLLKIAERGIEELD